MGVLCDATRLGVLRVWRNRECGSPLREKKIKRVPTRRKRVRPARSVRMSEPVTAPPVVEPTRKRRRNHKEDPIIPVAAFQRLVREISQERKEDIRWEGEALKALQVAAEAHLLEKFQRSDLLRELCNSKTLALKHFNESVTLEG